MERPLCPLCKTKHYAREAHVFKSNPPAEIERVEVMRVKGFDRGAYQREYMRFWRALKHHRVEVWPRPKEG